MITLRCNVLGPEGSGKTTLVKRLKCSDEKAGVFTTIATVGTYVEEVMLEKKTKCVLREFGGCMAPIWASAYDDCHVIIYVVDASNAAQLSTATVLLMQLLGDKKCVNKPVLLLFNKVDIAWCSPPEMKQTMRIDDLTKTYKLSIAESSCKTREGLDRIYNWIAVHSESIMAKQAH